MAFFVGQKVVCVDDADNFLGAALTNGLRKGQIYTIESIEGPFLRVGVTKWGWHKSRFRPVVEPKTDISIFTAMLTPKKVRETA